MQAKYVLSTVELADAAGGNPRLAKEIDVRGRELSAIPELAHCESLTRLNLSRNLLKDLKPVDRVHTLSWLDVSHNNVVRLQPLSELKSLKMLNAAYNKVKDLRPLSSLESLCALILNDNAVSGEALLPPLTTLNTLVLSRNQISEIEGVSRLVGLTKLSLANNQLRKFPSLPNMSLITELRLNNNKIRDMAPCLTHAWSLRLLDLGNNRVKQLPPTSVTSDLKLTNLNLKVLHESLPLLIPVQGNPLIPEDASEQQLSELRERFTTLTVLNGQPLDTNKHKGKRRQPEKAPTARDGPHPKVDEPQHKRPRQNQDSKPRDQPRSADKARDGAKKSKAKEALQGLGGWVEDRHGDPIAKQAVDTAKAKKGKRSQGSERASDPPKKKDKKGNPNPFDKASIGRGLLPPTLQKETAEGQQEGKVKLKKKKDKEGSESRTMSLLSKTDVALGAGTSAWD